MQNNAKDLIALASLSFKRKDFETAGTLFASAMETEDASEFIESLMADNYSLAALSSSLENISEESELDSLASAAATLSLSMESSFKDNTRAALSESGFIDESEFESDSACGDDDHEDDEDEDDVDFEVDDQDEDEDIDDDDYESESSMIDFGNVRSPIQIIE